jgi:hypothetical protein
VTCARAFLETKSRRYGLQQDEQLQRDSALQKHPLADSSASFVSGNSAQRHLVNGRMTRTCLLVVPRKAQ